jgi:hypothetical protein
VDGLIVHACMDAWMMGGGKMNGIKDGLWEKELVRAVQK